MQTPEKHEADFAVSQADLSQMLETRKCNYGKIALRQTSTCQALPFSITHLSPLIVADNEPSVCALSEGKKNNPTSSARMGEGQAPSRSRPPRAPAKPWWCPGAVLAQESWLAETFSKVTPDRVTLVVLIMFGYQNFLQIPELWPSWACGVKLISHENKLSGHSEMLDTSSSCLGQK